MNDVLPLRLSLMPAEDRPTPAPVGEPLLLSARDLAALLRLGLRTIRSMDRAGKLPEPIRIGGSIRWRRDEILLWIDSGCPNRATWARVRDARS